MASFNSTVTIEFDSDSKSLLTELIEALNAASEQLKLANDDIDKYRLLLAGDEISREET